MKVEHEDRGHHGQRRPQEAEGVEQTCGTTGSKQVIRRRDLIHHDIREFRSWVKVEVAVLGSPALLSVMVSVDVQQHSTRLASHSEPGLGPLGW